MRLLPKDTDFGWVTHIWLVFLLNIPFDAFLLKFTSGQWSLTILGMLTFLVLYFRGFWVEGRQLLWIVAPIALLGVVFGPMIPAACLYFVYAATFADRVSEKTAIPLCIIGALVLVIVLEALLLGLPRSFLVAGAVFTSLAGAIHIHYAQRRRDYKKLMRAQEEIEHLARIAERERIARDLHDARAHVVCDRAEVGTRFEIG